ncbi:hypothetical protein E2C01_013371 [Portunus trituberculatus]|uniref:Uncharacterized protein n=1 Tax=Portunus trituberculatus TaxID=210409 RepID=A0A5B7DH39_PORTR|nr:hypothetical protein [Portunus trituberculatus]
MTYNNTARKSSQAAGDDEATRRLERVQTNTYDGIKIVNTVDIHLFNTITRFYLEICVRLNHFIDSSKGLWRMAQSR